jgi:hypothetical protein
MSDIYLQQSLFDVKSFSAQITNDDLFDSAEFREYGFDHCWQYQIRLQNLADDIEEAQLTHKEIESLTVKDFEFAPLITRYERINATRFIQKHEWLGNLSQYTTHWFGAYYKNILAGVILLNMPNSFSKMLGEDTPKMERLISRGACISWSPKNLASSFIMWVTRWMVKNTDYRLFTAYSDPMAKELGTVYQACNFYYLGQSAGTTERYVNPYTGKIVSDRFFRQRSAYKKYCAELGIQWRRDWDNGTGMNWQNIPQNVEALLREKSKLVQNASQKISVPSKHKYALVLGATKKETKELKKLFIARNNVYAYPKDR